MFTQLSTPNSLAGLGQSISQQIITSSQFKRFQRMYKNDRIAFAYDVLGSIGQNLTDYQEEILGLFDDGYTRVAVRGPHGLGKTFLASILTHHSVLTAESDAKTITTASAWRQLEKYLWPEIRKISKTIDWQIVGRDPYDPNKEFLGLSIRLLSRTVEAFAVASDDFNTIEGAHASQLWYIFDEAKIIPRQTWNAAEGAFSNAKNVKLASKPDEFDEYMNLRSSLNNYNGQMDISEDPVTGIFTARALETNPSNIESSEKVDSENKIYEYDDPEDVIQDIGEYEYGSIVGEEQSVESGLGDQVLEKSGLEQSTKFDDLGSLINLEGLDQPLPSTHSSTKPSSSNAPLTANDPLSPKHSSAAISGEISIPSTKPKKKLHSRNKKACARDERFNVSEGTTDRAFAFAISTPGDPSGQFYDIHSHKPGYEDWYTKHVTVDDAIRAGRISTEWVNQRARQWGADSSIFQNRVLGEFADNSEDGIIPLSWIRASNERWKSWKALGGKDPIDGKHTLGVDVARGGFDKTLMARRIGLVVTDIWAMSRLSVVSTATKARNLARGSYIHIEMDGGLGAGVYDILHNEGVPNLRPIVVSASTWFHDKSKELSFLNVRAAMWWHMRELLDPQYHMEVCLPPVEELILDLSTPKWDVLKDATVRLESKDSIRERLGRSTDYGDSVCLAFWDLSSSGGGVVF